MNHTRTAIVGLIAAVLGLGTHAVAREEGQAASQRDTPKQPAKSRTFDFTYSAVVKDLPLGTKVRVWLPVPQSSEHQQIEQIDQSLPAVPKVATEPKYGNKVLYFQAKAPDSGEIAFSLTYRVARSEVLGLNSKSDVALADVQRKLFLAPDAKVPIDGKPVSLLDGLDLPKGDGLKLGELLYHKVEDHMKYDKSRPGYGTGDAAWACDSRFGNCTDFHSLFISLARSQGLPAQFEIGFPLPDERGQGEVGGYHCWAFFHVRGRGWMPVDISEADKHPEMKKYYFGNLTENRVTFSAGRDLTLVPKQAAGPLNFFIYPHVEVDGAAWPAEKIATRFAFNDVDAADQ